ncbi:S26 family signal peptidase [Capnocytophaga canis]|uniref:S26 family signal peptidase n=1 Tax=Capnocytophaga canis TaxID=1848903 RepID=UPI0019D570B9|nr:S26 family signal peptidase [Capnocytophaga canis]
MKKTIYLCLRFNLKSKFTLISKLETFGRSEFIGGDHLENFGDSRYWGLVPEEYIAGKAWFIWKSNDLYTGKLRMERILKKLTK